MLLGKVKFRARLHHLASSTMCYDGRHRLGRKISKKSTEPGQNLLLASSIVLTTEMKKNWVRVKQLLSERGILMNSMNMPLLRLMTGLHQIWLPVALASYIAKAPRIRPTTCASLYIDRYVEVSMMLNGHPFFQSLNGHFFTDHFGFVIR